MEEYVTGKYSLYEELFLKRFYKSYGALFCAFELSRKPQSIRAKARKLGLNNHALKDKKWSESEDNFLREHYISDGIEYCEDHLKRGYDGIVHRAQRLGLVIVPKWTKEETDLLKEVYKDTEIYKLMKIFPNKSRASIQIKASRMGLKKKKED